MLRRERTRPLRLTGLMSLARRQDTCAFCGKHFEKNDRVNIEPLIDPIIRYVAVHWNESTFTIHVRIEGNDIQPVG